MAKLSDLNFQSFEVNLRIEIKPTQMKVTKLRLFLTDVLTSRKLMKRLMREVIAESLLKAYRKRFDQARGTMADMERADGIETDPRRKQQLYDLIGEKDRQLVKLKPGSDAAIKLSKEISDLTERTEGLKRLGGEPGLTGSGKVVDNEGNLVSEDRPSIDTTAVEGGFKVLMEKVQGLMFDTELIKSEMVGPDLVFAFGNIPEISDVKTPSYADSTDSAANVLWRHLEFGTGVYAKPGSRRHGGKRGRGLTKDGKTWWLGSGPDGPGVGVGLHLKGSKAGNFLRQASGAPYDADALSFSRVFVEKMNLQLGIR